MPKAFLNGPVFDSGGPPPPNGTAFPLKQTAIQVTADGVQPDAAANKSGATLTLVNWVDARTSQFRLQIPGLGIDTTFTSTNPLKYDGNGNVLHMQGYNLNYVELGVWQVGDTIPSAITHYGAFITGYETPRSGMPSTGTATYSEIGNVNGLVMTSDQSLGGAPLTGNASFSVNFATGKVTGQFTGMIANNGISPVVLHPWNDVSVTASIASRSSQFNGTTKVTSAPAETFALDASATGKINGGFYGPHAENLGAVWSLSDGEAAAIGTVGARRLP